ncbi:uncharacterized protein TOT_020000332 [Theileria orientalis strain Shintoku]|uniref:ubiquitinyl hydrolase 1 n=1 Tax=Theileria orientalis strain Shintoku TaxID=869250 RepID=J4C829_THEOR|nr:uncharacterized protein TOT_020000332 [Theileria orientalis strain Shintoku]BAM40068.1 uncharacterized protein TOT_020000332 [Theileria orientalis strain Shintoku]|eukprot:XP_009690369.1 uncharacterized protein TOT_020000332 [Theileria orientalis strain Shintoku]
MSNFKTKSPIIVELHNKDIKFEKYNSNERDSTDKSKSKEEKTVLAKEQFKIVNNMATIKGIYKVPSVKYDDDTITMGSGLNNPGINICYMNVIIQVLSHTPLLSSALLKSYHTKVCKNNENNIFCVMCLFEKHLQNSYVASNALNNPFYSIAKKYIYSKFKLNQQDDSFIFLKFFLDSLSKSCYFSTNTSTDDNWGTSSPNTNVANRNHSAEGAPSSPHGRGIAVEDRERPAEEQEINLNNIIITNDKIMHTFIGYLFGGYFRNFIICNRCNNRSEKVEEFFDISVDTTKSNELINLLNDFVVPEQLEGSNQYLCSKCNSLQNATKLLSVYKCPQILTVHLKRFNMNQSSVDSSPCKQFYNKATASGYGSYSSNKSNEGTVNNSKFGYCKNKFSKLTNRIHFPHNLSISMEAKKGEQTWVNYEIYAIVCHLGQSLNSGHYITFIKGKNNFWFLFDDSTVRVVSNEYVKRHENDVYILFYSNVSTTTSPGGPSSLDECGESGSVDNLLNEYSQTNKFCTTSEAYKSKADQKAAKMSKRSKIGVHNKSNKSGSADMDEGVEGAGVKRKGANANARDAVNVSGRSTGINSDEAVSSNRGSSTDNAHNGGGAESSGDESIDSNKSIAGSDILDFDDSELVIDGLNSPMATNEYSANLKDINDYAAIGASYGFISPKTTNDYAANVKDINDYAAIGASYGFISPKTTNEYSANVKDINDYAASSKDINQGGMGSARYTPEEISYRLIHVLSKFKGKMCNTFLKLRKFKNYRLLLIRLLASAYSIYGASIEDSNPVMTSPSNGTRVKHPIETDIGNYCSNNGGIKGYNVWSEEEGEKAERYKRLYSSLEGDAEKPDEEELEYDKGRPRKYKKKTEDERYEFKRHHTGVQIAVNQKDVFDSTEVKVSRSNEADATKKRKKTKTKKRKKTYTKHK